MNRRIKNAHWAGFAHGYSQASRMIFMGIVFTTGSFLIAKYDYDPERIYICINVLMHAAMGIGMSMSNLPSVERAKASAKTIFEIIDEKSTLDVRDGKLAKHQEVNGGSIEFKDVTFKYPSRDQIILKDFHMKIEDTQKIALVGASGCGKSTITQILLRFYNLEKGKVFLDGKPLEDYNVENLRRSIGFVMQEPILFNQSIKDNVLYGLPTATDQEIRRACEQANALGFIEQDQSVRDEDKDLFDAFIKKNEYEDKKENEKLELFRDHKFKLDLAAKIAEVGN